MPKEKKEKKARSDESKFRSLLIPTIVITIICLISVTILVWTYEITKPIIETNNANIIIILYDTINSF